MPRHPARAARAWQAAQRQGRAAAPAAQPGRAAAGPGAQATPPGQGAVLTPGVHLPPARRAAPPTRTCRAARHAHSGAGRGSRHRTAARRPWAGASSTRCRRLPGSQGGGRRTQLPQRAGCGAGYACPLRQPRRRPRRRPRARGQPPARRAPPSPAPLPSRRRGRRAPLAARAAPARPAKHAPGRPRCRGGGQRRCRPHAATARAAWARAAPRCTHGTGAARAGWNAPRAAPPARSRRPVRGPLAPGGQRPAPAHSAAGTGRAPPAPCPPCRAARAGRRGQGLPAPQPHWPSAGTVCGRPWPPTRGPSPPPAAAPRCRPGTAARGPLPGRPPRGALRPAPPCTPAPPPAQAPPQDTGGGMPRHQAAPRRR